MLLTFIAGVTSWIVPDVANAVAYPAQQLLDYIVWLARQIEQLPNAAQVVHLGIWGFVGAMMLLIAALVYMQRRTRHSFREDNVVQ
jgi:hypothetical protein